MTGTLFDWSTTAASNTSLEGINVNTGMSAANVDNGFRALMAAIKNSFSSTLQNFLAGSSPLAVASGGTGATSLSGITVPAGTIIHVCMNSAPTGYLKADGAAISRTTYAALYAAIGTTFGAGDGSTTFNLPDLRGEFVRGWDDSRGVDSGRVFGSAQLDQMQTITGTIGGAVQFQGATGAATGAFTYTNTSSGNSSGSSNAGSISFNSGNSPGARTGSETRPRNIALLACIKI